MLRFIAKLLGGNPASTNECARPPRRPRAAMGVEELMPRILPSAGPLTLGPGHFAGPGGSAQFSPPLAPGGSPTTQALDSIPASSGSTSGGSCQSMGTTLSATLSDSSGATGMAQFNAATGSLTVSVKGATASTSLTVTVNGTTVGTLATDASGNGFVTISNVTALAGQTVSVGDLTGTFSQVQFSATLTGATGVTGTASFDVVHSQLQVLISGAAASTTYNVTIDGTVVGQLTTNSSGNAMLKLALTNITITSGSTITISDTAGNSAILTGTFS